MTIRLVWDADNPNLNASVKSSPEPFTAEWQWEESARVIFTQFCRGKFVFIQSDESDPGRALMIVGHHAALIASFNNDRFNSFWWTYPNFQPACDKIHEFRFDYLLKCIDYALAVRHPTHQPYFPYGWSGLHVPQRPLIERISTEIQELGHPDAQRS